MSPRAWSALRAEAERRPGGIGEDRVDGARRAEVIRSVLRDGEVVTDPSVAAIGRRVTFREADGETLTVALVIPGDGDPSHGWISVDAPIGSALIGCRPGDEVVVRAPSGPRAVVVERVA